MIYNITGGFPTAEMIAIAHTAHRKDIFKLIQDVPSKPYFEDKKRNVILFKSDCFDVLPNIPENSIDMIFADPPYFLSNGGFTCHAGKKVPVHKGKWDISKGKEENYLFTLRWLRECQRVLTPNGTIWVSGTSHIIYAVGYAMQDLGYKILNDIAWFKVNPPPNLSCRYFTHSTETILWAAKNKNSKHYFNYPLMRKMNNNKQMLSLWAIKPPAPEEKKYGKHPTQKPLQLLDRIVLASTMPGDIVLDPFNGSSTTGVAAVKEERQFIGIELEEEYLKTSIKRIKEASENIKNRVSKIAIPGYVSSWTDEYFHKSAFEAPIRYPNKKIIDFLSQFKKKERVKLYRGINKYNGENWLITSWTYDKKSAENYIKEGGKVIEKEFAPEDILLDTTILNMEQKQLLGYDYEVDDKEVLIFRIK